VKKTVDQIIETTIKGIQAPQRAHAIAGGGARAGQVLGDGGGSSSRTQKGSSRTRTRAITRKSSGQSLRAPSRPDSREKEKDEDVS